MSRRTFLSRVHIPCATAFRAFQSVRTELRSAGLMPSGGELDGVSCEWHPVELGSFAVTGYRLSDFTTLGYYWNRTIHVPAWGVWFKKDACIRDIIRHEFGHAVADIFRDELRKHAFRYAFGAPCGRRVIARFRQNWEETCVSQYAATNTEEDWAETFMLFIQHKGQLPIRYRGLPRIESKWAAVGTILEAIAKGK